MRSTKTGDIYWDVLRAREYADRIIRRDGPEMIETFTLTGGPYSTAFVRALHVNGWVTTEPREFPVRIEMRWRTKRYGMFGIGHLISMLQCGFWTWFRWRCAVAVGVRRADRQPARYAVLGQEPPCERA